MQIQTFHLENLGDLTITSLSYVAKQIVYLVSKKIVLNPINDLILRRIKSLYRTANDTNIIMLHHHLKGGGKEMRRV